MMQEFGEHFESLQSVILEWQYDHWVNMLCACTKGPALFRCEQCFQNAPSCAECLVTSHHHHPFHHIQKWNDTHFVRTTLGTLGHIIILGHDCEKCPNSLQNSEGRPFTIVDASGIHKINIKFCHCHGDPDEALQLTSAGLFPATMQQPETAFTFEVLKEYQAHTLASKKSGFNYFTALQHLTDNAFPGSVLVRVTSLAVDFDLTLSRIDIASFFESYEYGVTWAVSVVLGRLTALTLFSPTENRDRLQFVAQRARRWALMWQKNFWTNFLLIYGMC